MISLDIVGNHQVSEKMTKKQRNRYKRGQIFFKKIITMVGFIENGSFKNCTGAKIEKRAYSYSVNSRGNLVFLLNTLLCYGL